MYFTRHPVQFTLLMAIMTLGFSFGFWIVVNAVLASRQGPFAIYALALAVVVFLMLGIMAAKFVMWLQTYYYFHKLRKQLASLHLSNGAMVEFDHRALRVVVMRASMADNYVVAIGNEEYTIGPYDISPFWKTTVTEELPGNRGKIDRPVEQFITADRRRMFKTMVYYLK